MEILQVKPAPHMCRIAALLRDAANVIADIIVKTT
jgi:hypothetical protein